MMAATTGKTPSVVIRPANRDDCKGIMRLKKELASHQNMGHLPMLSVEDLQRDGFDLDPPLYHCLVGEAIDKESPEDDGILGYALYFYGWAVWEGKVLHLEDLCVSAKARGKGVGHLLMKQLSKVALEENCARMQLEVLDWNEIAVKFYESHGGWNTTKVEGWHNFRLGKEAMQKLIRTED